jgi:large subunit ribosomal protein L37Ae
MKKGRKAVNRFGPRYGRTIKSRVADIESKPTGKCISCNSEKLEREATGIWKCRKCGTRFTGKAYQVT